MGLKVRKEVRKEGLLSAGEEVPALVQALTLALGLCQRNSSSTKCVSSGDEVPRAELALVTVQTYL